MNISWPTIRHRVKAASLVLLGLILLVLVFQNWEPAETRVLFWRFVLPRSVLLLACALAGFAAGIAVTMRGR